MIYIMFPFENIAVSVRVAESKVRGANLGPTWVLSAPDGPHFGLVNLAIRRVTKEDFHTTAC